MSEGRPRRRRAPGWYRDPDDPTRLRHWSGRSWSLRRRSWPAWDIAGTDVVADPRLPGGPDAGADGSPVTDGPVRPAPLPAAAARSALGAGGTVAWMAKPAPAPHRPGSRRVGAAVPPGPLDGQSSGWATPRRPMVVFAGLVAMALVIMAVSVGMGRAGVRANAVSSDTAFVDRAGALCASSLHPSPPAATMTAVPPTFAEQAASAAGDADKVAKLVDGLAAIATTPSASGGVTAWLATLRAYVDDARRLADGLRSAPPGGQAALASLRQHVDADVTQADSFAALNGLGACQLGADPTTAGSVIAVP